MARMGSTEKNIFMCLGPHILATLGGSIKGQDVGRNIWKEIPFVYERRYGTGYVAIGMWRKDGCEHG